MILNTNEDGKLNYQPKAGSHYQVRIKKEGFTSFETMLNSNDLPTNRDFCFPLEKSKCNEFNLTVLDKTTMSLMPNATVTVVNNTLNTEKKRQLNEDGSLELCIDNKYQYTFKADQSGYVGSEKTILQLTSQESSKDLVLYMSRPSETNPTTNDCHSCPTEKINELHEYFLGATTDKFEVDQVITLEDIYYDYDESNIRNDASQSLDHVVELLNLYPSMEISLRAHTDARGEYFYNEVLSQSRAKEALKYITSRGISSKRISYKGLGESVLKNKCGDGVFCTEEQHQENRRTEIKITKLDGK